MVSLLGKGEGIFTGPTDAGARMHAVYLQRFKYTSPRTAADSAGASSAILLVGLVGLDKKIDGPGSGGR